MSISLRVRVILLSMMLFNCALPLNITDIAKSVISSTTNVPGRVYKRIVKKDEDGRSQKIPFWVMVGMLAMVSFIKGYYGSTKK